MRKQQKAGLVLAAAGAVLILSALLLLLHNRQEDRSAGAQAQTVLEELRSRPTQASASSLPSELPPDESPELATVTVDGYDYIGTLSIPALELELPVQAQWDYDRLRIAPCRQFGAPQTEDFVIAAHNYRSHFGRLSELAPGDAVIFTAVDGTQTLYSVAELRKLAADDVEGAQNSGYPLVLYTCTPGGAARMAVFCGRQA